MNANQEIIAELRRVLGERDAAREQLDLTKRELGRWVDRETQSARERDELRAQRGLALGRLENAIQLANQYAKERDLALGRLENEIKAANQARMAEERARESLEEIDEAIYDCLPCDDDESPLDCVEHAADRLRELAKERDEAIRRITEVGAMVATNGNLLAKDAYRRGAEAMREACAEALMHNGLVISRERAANVVRALPIPEEP